MRYFLSEIKIYLHYYSITFFVIVQSLIQGRTKLSRSQGFRLRGTNREELLSIRVIVQAHVDVVQALVALFQVHVDLVQALVALVQAHLPPEGLIWVVMGQFVVGP